MKTHLRRTYAEDREKVTCGRCQQMIFSERQYAAIAKIRAKEE